MELLQEVKKSNKQAFNSLIEKYNHIFYKAARLYFFSDKDVYTVLEHSFTKAFREIVNFKTEKEFLCATLRIIIIYGAELKQKYSKDVDRKIRNKEFSVNIGDKITSTESMVDNAEYQAYRRSSVVEEYITSIEEGFRPIAFLYYYANLTPEEISKILKISEFSVNNKLKPIRIKIYEMIKNKEVDL